MRSWAKTSVEFHDLEGFLDRLQPADPDHPVGALAATPDTRAIFGIVPIYERSGTKGPAVYVRGYDVYYSGVPIEYTASPKPLRARSW